MRILGIETSCDETALALIEARSAASGEVEIRVLSSLVHSQADLHSAYGGVFPSLAKREHGKNLVPLLHKLLTEASSLADSSAPAELASRNGMAPSVRGEERLRSKPAISVRSDSPRSIEISSELAFKALLESFKAEIAPQNPELYESFSHAPFLTEMKGSPVDVIAVTEGPGLEPALWVGVNFARMLAALWNVPIIAADHMEGHIVGSLVPSDAPTGAWHALFAAPMPAIALLISGGHTQLVHVRALGDYEIVGETKDDAVGEAFDKAARLLGLPYPGGPHLSMLAGKAREAGIAAPVSLPRPMEHSKDLDFSFSGLKTAVLYATRTAPKDASGTIDEAWKMGLAREFEDAVKETLDGKLRAAIEQIDARSIIVGGGVSANHVLRAAFEKTATEYGIPIFMPSRHISGDNALMIAVAGALHSGTHTTASKLKADGTKRLDN